MVILMILSEIIYGPLELLEKLIPGTGHVLIQYLNQIFDTIGGLLH
jgi:hypothetical protein